MAHHLGSEAVVAEEDIAEAGYQDVDRGLPRCYMRRILR
jgi:hypothetical protein